MATTTYLSGDSRGLLLITQCKCELRDVQLEKEVGAASSLTCSGGDAYTAGTEARPRGSRVGSNMQSDESITVRPLEATDASAIRRILETSEYVHYRFSPEELPRLLRRYPAAGGFSVPSSRLA